MQTKNSYYAVARGVLPGIYLKWSDCKAQVENFKNPVFKKFNSREEADIFVNQYITLIGKYKNSIDQQDQKLNDAVNRYQTISEQDPNDTYINKFLAKLGLNPQECNFVFTDGGCRKNGQQSAIAGIGIFFAENDNRNKSILVKGKATNNTAELLAFVELFKIIELDILQNKTIVVVSDSIYAIRCVTDYGEKCENDQWIKQIPNKDIVKQAYYLYKQYNNVYFAHIMAHSNGNGRYSKGNQSADYLANQAMNYGQGIVK